MWDAAGGACCIVGGAESESLFGCEVREVSNETLGGEGRVDGVLEVCLCWVERRRRATRGALSTLGKL